MHHGALVHHGNHRYPSRVKEGGHTTIATITRARAGSATAAAGGQAHRAVTVLPAPVVAAAPGAPAAAAWPARARSRAARASRRTAMALAGGREARYFASSGIRELAP